MKKLFKINVICIAILICLLMITGCSGRTASAKDVEFLTASEYWYHFDEVTGECEKMSFREEFEFYWGCECGEPVGDSDCYELYDYNKETSIIKLYNDYDDMSMEIEVVDYSDYHLLLKVDGEIKDYTYSDPGIDVVESEKYMSGYAGVFSMHNGTSEEVELGPFDYDGDEEYPENAKRTYKLAEDATFYELFAFTKYKDGVEVENTVDFNEINLEKALYHIEYGGYGFVWFNDNLEISKIMIYGSTRAEE